VEVLVSIDSHDHLLAIADHRLGGGLRDARHGLLAPALIGTPKAGRRRTDQVVRTVKMRNAAKPLSGHTPTSPAAAGTTPDRGRQIKTRTHRSVVTRVRPRTGTAPTDHHSRSEWRRLGTV
jgi:hypothetical protein